MPYREPIFFKGGYYHVYSRGSEKRVIFFDRADRGRFLKRLKEYKKDYGISIICFCLMPNHYHLLVRQDKEELVSRFVHKLNLAYAMYFNKRYERVGPLFQGRFKAKVVESDEYLINLSRYIHLNPIELVGNDKLGQYPWSSLQYYIGKDANDLVDNSAILSHFGKGNLTGKYLDFVKAGGKKKLKAAMEDLLFEEISPIQVRGLRLANE